MEKVGNLETIKRAFLDESNIDKEVLEKRREICNTCEYNSLNIDEKELTLVQKARKKLHKDPFCTACGCQILEKTSQETEECGLAGVGKTPKWFRVKLETVSRMDLDIINQSINKMNIDLTPDKKYYQIDLGRVKMDVDSEIQFLLKSKSNFKMIMNHVTPSCGSCTNSSFKTLDDNTVQVNLSLNLQEIPFGKFTKNVYLGYDLRNDYKQNVIKITGIKI